jgi:hypothetical protein
MPIAKPIGIQTKLTGGLRRDGNALSLLLHKANDAPTRAPLVER